MYDTIVLKSPPIPLELKDALLNFCRVFQSIDYCDGEIFYCFYSGNLDGSYDYRIRLNIDNREWIKPEGTKVPISVETDWYIKVECSLHKLLFNHNVYGGPTEIKASILYLIRFLEEKTGLSLPVHQLWEVERIDVAKIFVFNTYAICKKVLDSLKNGVYSRRKARPYDNGVMFSGSTTTCKFYGKGDEYKEHDYKRFNKYIAREIDLAYGKENYDRVEQKLIFLKWEIDKVLERAKRTIRFEVEIKPRKLKDIFNAEKITVDMLNDEILHNVMESELRKCIKEDEDMDIVRRSDLVIDRLNNVYGTKLSNCLYSVWAKMVQFGEKSVKADFSKSTFLRYKKQLLDAGVSWMVTNVNLKQLSIVPDDFTFLNDKYVDDSVASEVLQKLKEVA